jgi:predicted enzyme related to lactoylglutathione lyase
MIKKIATAAVYVDDQERAVEFWTTQVGFEVRSRKPMGPHASWIEVGPPGAESCLVIYPKTMMQDWAERKPSIVFECDNLAQAYDAMLGRGVQFTQPPQAMPWGPFAIFVDPQGNWYGLREAAKSQ